jgi:hypothetical protein
LEPTDPRLAKTANKISARVSNLDSAWSKVWHQDEVCHQPIPTTTSLRPSSENSTEKQILDLDKHPLLKENAVLHLLREKTTAAAVSTNAPPNRDKTP